MDSVPVPGAVGWVAGAVGITGLLVVVFGARVRSIGTLVVLFAFIAITVGGALLSRSDEATRPWGLGLVLAGAGLGAACSVFLTRRDLVLRTERDEASAEALRATRDRDTVETARSALDEQLRSARARIQEFLSRAEAEGIAEPETVARFEEALERLRSSEEKLRQIIDATRDGVAMLEDETLRITQLSPSVARLTGYGPDELRERTLLDLLEHGPEEPGRADLQRVARERRPLRATLVRRDGTRLPVEISVLPVGEDENAQLVALVSDVSTTVRLRDELESAREQIAERDRMLEDARARHSSDATRVGRLELQVEELRGTRDLAIEAAAHDLRVPLTSVRSYSEILLRHEDTDPQMQREFLEIIRSESERLTRMIDELLDVRRVSRGVQPLAAEELDLRDLLRESLAAVGGAARERGVTFEGVWDRDARLVSGEPDRLRRMLVNLLANAVEFSSDGGAVEILLRDGRDEGATLLGIRDHASSTAGEEEADLVFERFHAASEGPDSAPGNGVGMSICREIAEAHGARMWPETGGAAGRTLWVEFPAPGALEPVA